MTSKTIKKVISAKINDWLDSITDQKTRELAEKNTIVTGGCFISLLNNDKPNDFDIYFRNKETVLAVSEYYISRYAADAGIIEKEDGRIKIFVKSKGVSGQIESEEDIQIDNMLDKQKEETTVVKDGYCPVFYSSNAMTLSNKIQIIVRFYGEPSEIHENYDFIHCTCYWTSWDNEVVLPARALEAVINKELYYVGSKYPLCSIIRTRKFIKRGWSINAGQYLKMCLQLNTFDLLNLEVLEDQLTGVDSRYFESAISALKEKQTADTEFKINNSYLISIINKIF